jgi:Zn-dependent oligopeptidase
MPLPKNSHNCSTDFSNHVLDATKAFAFIITDTGETEGWPETLKQIAAQSWNGVNKEDPTATFDNGPWRITLDYPSYVPFMEHHRNRSHREQVYRAHILRASTGELDNSGLIDRILTLRKEKAQMLGYANYADLSLDSKMAQDVVAVQKMFSQNWCRPPGSRPGQSWMNCVNWPRCRVRLSPWPIGMYRFGLNGCGSDASNIQTNNCALISPCLA